jgi:hypothetical protein
MPDSKLVEIVKDGNIQVALFLACLFLLITNYFVAFSLPSWGNALVWFGFFFFGCLTVFQIVGSYLSLRSGR